MQPLLSLVWLVDITSWAAGEVVAGTVGAFVGPAWPSGFGIAGVDHSKSMLGGGIVFKASFIVAHFAFFFRRTEAQEA